MSEELTDFELFKKEFGKWQRKFGLTGYKIYFKYEPIVDAFADITIEQADMVVTVRLNSKHPKDKQIHCDVRQSAKHEAMHLLIHRLEYLGRCRYVNGDEINEATEELVRKLENLIGH